MRGPSSCTGSLAAFQHQGDVSTLVPRCEDLPRVQERLWLFHIRAAMEGPPSSTGALAAFYIRAAMRGPSSCTGTLAAFQH
ncbi:hypothetical protein DPMN_084647 [Dreissena polymorpha]|uniref:Uncharacterized protein n=1 Tax=Dreissena polymorpha TaxID=45954 RepID=A0A9D3YB62_DREPO|nr:hypothetical protein DPMN_084647 [Dreissena polymorpha]